MSTTIAGQQFNDAMYNCWWFPSWIVCGGGTPDEQAKQAFLSLYAHSVKDLQNTMLPAQSWLDTRDEQIHQVWPSQRDLFLQYEKLLQRICELFSGSHRLSDVPRAACLNVTGYYVELIKSPCSRTVPLRTGIIKGREMTKISLLNIAKNLAAHSLQFWVASGNVVDAFVSRSGFVTKSFYPSDVAALATLKFRKDLNGCVVRIKSRTEVLVQERLLEFVESTEELSIGCWHAARILHRSRRSGSCEAIVEA